MRRGYSQVCPHYSRLAGVFALPRRRHWNADCFQRHLSPLSLSLMLDLLRHPIPPRGLLRAGPESFFIPHSNFEERVEEKILLMGSADALPFPCGGDDDVREAIVRIDITLSQAQTYSKRHTLLCRMNAG